MQNLLSDAELLETYRASDGDTVPRLLQRVQSAVLAKAEVEARERERTAWDNARAWMWGRSLAFKDVCVNSLSGDEERDRLYPSLRPPKTVTLSTGEWERKAHGRWARRCAGTYDGYVMPQCNTADDYERVAAYLRAEGK